MYAYRQCTRDRLALPDNLCYICLRIDLQVKGLNPIHCSYYHLLLTHRFLLNVRYPKYCCICEALLQKITKFAKLANTSAVKLNKWLKTQTTSPYKLGEGLPQLYTMTWNKNNKKVCHIIESGESVAGPGKTEIPRYILEYNIDEVPTRGPHNDISVTSVPGRNEVATTLDNSVSTANSTSLIADAKNHHSKLNKTTILKENIDTLNNNVNENNKYCIQQEKDNTSVDSTPRSQPWCSIQADNDQESSIEQELKLEIFDIEDNVDMLNDKIDENTEISTDDKSDIKIKCRPDDRVQPNCVMLDSESDQSSGLAVNTAPTMANVENDLLGFKDESKFKIIEINKENESDEDIKNQLLWSGDQCNLENNVTSDDNKFEIIEIEDDDVHMMVDNNSQAASNVPPQPLDDKTFNYSENKIRKSRSHMKQELSDLAKRLHTLRKMNECVAEIDDADIDNFKVSALAREQKRLLQKYCQNNQT